MSIIKSQQSRTLEHEISTRLEGMKHDLHMIYNFCLQNLWQSNYLFRFVALPDPRPAPFFPDAGSAAPPLFLAKGFTGFLVAELPAPFKSTCTWTPREQQTS